MSAGKAKDTRLVVDFNDLPPPIKKGQREWTYNCPYCAELRGKEDRDGKLKWNPSKRVGSCWKCKTLVLDKGARDMDTVYELYYRREPEKRETTWYDVSWTRPAWEVPWAAEYLSGRGFDESVARRYNVLCSEVPERCLVLPDLLEGGKTNFFQLRYLQADSKIKYTNPTGADKPVYGLHTLGGRSKSFVCEGCFSSMSMAGVDPEWGSVATYGKSPSREQLLAINSTESLREICVAHDGGEIESLLNCLQEFLQTDKTVSFVLLPFKEDPNSMEPARLRACFERLRFECTDAMVDILRMDKRRHRWRDMDPDGWRAFIARCVRLRDVT